MVSFAYSHHHDISSIIPIIKSYLAYEGNDNKT